MYPLRGRDAELELLVSAWEKSRQGNVQYVRVSGEPGMGKTRLVQELYQILTTRYDPQLDMGREGYWPDLALGANTIDSLRPEFPKGRPPRGALPFMWWAITCPPGNEHDREGFSPFLDAMDQLVLHLDGIMRAKLVKDAWLETGRSVMEAGLGFSPAGPLIDVYAALRSIWQLGRRQRELKSARDVTSVAGATDIYNGQKPEDMISRMLATLNDEADSKLPTVPLVLVVDDAQWADARSLGFLQRMLDLGLRRGWKLLCISTIRSNELAAQLAARQDDPGRLSSTAAELEHGLLRHADGQCVTRIELGQDLTRESMAGIISDHLPGASDETISRIVQRAGEHPFYAVNYAKLVEEEGWLDGNGALKVGDAELSRIPLRVGEVIDRRLRLLDGDRLRVLQWGSVMGQKFLDELITYTAEHLGMQRGRASVMLGDLGRIHQLVTREQKLATSHLYSFRHRLIFERVRQSFGADNEEHTLVEEYLGNVLRLQFEGGQLDEWPFDERRNALKWLSEHAEKRAGTVSDEKWQSVMINSFLAYYETLPIQASSSYADMMSLKAMELYALDGNYHAAHWIACSLMSRYSHQRNYEEFEKISQTATVFWNEARKLSPESPPRSPKFLLHFASKYIKPSELPEAMELLKIALDACNPIDKDLLLRIKTRIAVLTSRMGDVREAEKMYCEILDQCNELNEYSGLTELLTHHAICRLKCGNQDGVLDKLEKAIEHARGNDDLFGQIFALNNLGIFISESDFLSGISYLQTSARLSEDVYNKHAELFAKAAIGSMYFENNKISKATDYFRDVAYAVLEDRQWEDKISAAMYLCRCNIIQDVYLDLEEMHKLISETSITDNMDYAIYQLLRLDTCTKLISGGFNNDSANEILLEICRCDSSNSIQDLQNCGKEIIAAILEINQKLIPHEEMCILKDLRLAEMRFERSLEKQ